MKRLREQDYSILGLLQQAPEGLSFNELLEKSSNAPVDLRCRLYRLIEHNLATITSADDSARYLISEQNEKITIRKACCPICKTIKLVGGTQHSTQCSNATCTNRGGIRRQYWLANTDALRAGIIRPINIAN